MTDVRLSLEELRSIKDCALRCFGVLAQEVEIFLFGSRVRLDLKGGDIDLLLVTDDELVDQLLNCRIDFLIELKHMIGEQKVDLIIAGRSTLDRDPFLKSVWKEARSIYRW